MPWREHYEIVLFSFFSEAAERAGAVAPAYVCGPAVQSQNKLKTRQLEFYKFRIFS